MLNEYVHNSLNGLVMVNMKFVYTSTRHTVDSCVLFSAATCGPIQTHTFTEVCKAFQGGSSSLDQSRFLGMYLPSPPLP